jgi:hypothetical protein
MLQLCVFGGYEGPLSAEKKCCFTVFGSCELRRPTLARQIIRAGKISEGHVPAPKMIFVTVFGSTEIKSPTLAEEFIDLREAIRNRALDFDRWDFYIAELDRWNSSSLMSLTLFGSFEETHLPTEEEEVEGLALQRHFGALSEESGRILEMGVGQAGAQRRSVVRQAILAD